MPLFFSLEPIQVVPADNNEHSRSVPHVDDITCVHVAVDLDLHVTFCPWGGSVSPTLISL